MGKDYPMGGGQASASLDTRPGVRYSTTTAVDLGPLAPAGPRGPGQTKELKRRMYALRADLAGGRSVSPQLVPSRTRARHDAASLRRVLSNVSLLPQHGVAGAFRVRARGKRSLGIPGATIRGPDHSEWSGLFSLTYFRGVPHAVPPRHAGDPRRAGP